MRSCARIRTVTLINSAASTSRAWPRPISFSSTPRSRRGSCMPIPPAPKRPHSAPQQRNIRRRDPQPHRQRAARLAAALLQSAARTLAPSRRPPDPHPVGRGGWHRPARLWRGAPPPRSGHRLELIRRPAIAHVEQADLVAKSIERFIADAAHESHVLPSHALWGLDLSVRNKYRSVWLVLPNSYYDPEKGAALYERYLDELELCAELGFDGIMRQRASPERPIA